MNRIYWDIDKISMLTDHLDASAHSHGMIQFFLCLEDELEIRVGKEKIMCSCILVRLNLNWHGEDTFVQNYAVVVDYGVYDNPDSFFEQHRQTWSKLKNFAYVHYGRKVMNRNVDKIRKRI